MQSILVYYDSAGLMENLILLFFLILYYDSARLMQNLILLFLFIAFFVPFDCSFHFTFI